MIRWFTAAVISGLCGFAAMRGGEIVRFAYAVPRPEAVGDSDRQWVRTPGLRGAALERMLAAQATSGGSDTAAKQTTILRGLLSNRPASSSAWLSLAGMRLVSGQTQIGALPALAMSRITGPDEAGLMWQRGVFGLLEWGALSVSARQHTIADLSGVLGLLDDSELKQVATIAGGMSAEARAEIRQMLAAEGVDTAALAGIGL